MKVTALRALYMSHVEAVQNVVRLHKASSNAGLEEISSLAASNAHSVEEVGTIDEFPGVLSLLIRHGCFFLCSGYNSFCFFIVC